MSSDETLVPSAMYAPLISSSFFNGRSIPSKIFEIIPGPKSADIGFPVVLTGSPGISPVVPS